MLQVPLWSRILVLILILAGILEALPNVLPASVRAHLPGRWGNQTVSLGLDLRGGSSMLLEVQFGEVEKEKVESLGIDVGHALRKAHVAFDNRQLGPDWVSFHIVGHQNLDQAKSLMDGVNPTIGTGLLGGGGRQFDLSELPGDTLKMQMSESYKTQALNDIVNQSMEVVRKRIDELGTTEPSIERQGEDRISVQVPGLSDPTRLIKILQTTEKMTFQLVDEAGDVERARTKGDIPIGDELLPVVGNRNGPQTERWDLVQKRVLVSGDRMTDAKADFDQRSGQPCVNFRFDSLGAKQFGDVTKDNVGHRFAIVLDKKVISDPTIQDAILGGSGIITGNFTTESANDLAILLRAGALPAPLTPIDQNTVGPELGKDSVSAGGWSTLAGLILVILFMVGRYGLFGVFADVALICNLTLLMAILTALGATLTLPGIAGIVLTMGMAVDANVLIYERIREEQRNGRGMIASIDAGFRRAMATIIDANATHLIASLILFQLGSGPVRGFAVTLGLGIVTSFFTAVMVTRLIVIQWLTTYRPKRLLI